MKDIMLIVLGVVGGSIGTLCFIQNQIKIYTRKFIESEINRDNNNIHFDSKEEANKVSEDLFKLLTDYEYVSVADLYDLIGEVSSFEHNKIGWTDLAGMRIIGYGHEYILKMPKTIILK